MTTRPGETLESEKEDPSLSNPQGRGSGRTWGVEVRVRSTKSRGTGRRVPGRVVVTGGVEGPEDPRVGIQFRVGTTWEGVPGPGGTETGAVREVPRAGRATPMRS